MTLSYLPSECSDYERVLFRLPPRAVDGAVPLRLLDGAGRRGDVGLQVRPERGAQGAEGGEAEVRAQPAEGPALLPVAVVPVREAVELRVIVPPQRVDQTLPLQPKLDGRDADGNEVRLELRLGLVGRDDVNPVATPGATAVLQRRPEAPVDVQPPEGVPAAHPRLPVADEQRPVRAPGGGDDGGGQVLPGDGELLLQLIVGPGGLVRPGVRLEGGLGGDDGGDEDVGAGGGEGGGGGVHGKPLGWLGPSHFYLACTRLIRNPSFGGAE
ncbi:MAG: hypothetical protein CO029_02960 [Candidatus Magasanikbacteria bacterium CG_4_9_14_0_2_um_filter_41_10]|nr:MAG: hypothetical protein AUJ37_02620 [Candidatus Magasanikbacteria bacterium CG1_02_41_34]PJC53398.1 MAG: hypothetical protein CO029_02960 [Candidatus Magasanikbacteria bacterium CG_4_9_14_0_2_um_filter_41_10]